MQVSAHNPPDASNPSSKRSESGRLFSCGLGYTWYDDFGNIQQLSTPGFAALNLNPSATTNRLGLSGARYDAAGNLTDITIGSESFDYAFDGATMMKHLRSNTDQARVFIYNASDERILTFDCFGPGATSTCTTQPASLTWTLRGLQNEVLRVYDQPAGGSFGWTRDYVHRGGQTLATIEPDGSGGELTSHLHLDHLGTPLQITRGGQQVALHNYYPFGQEATSAGADEIQLKFTGHERDKTGTGVRSELDYMHARYCSPVLGRFLSVDPAKSSVLTQSTTWNRYSYVSNNPLRYNDPSGLRQNPVTGRKGISPRPASAVLGRIRSNDNNRRVGLFGMTRHFADGTERFHPGIDINAPAGTRLFAAEGGTVSRRRNALAGNQIVIKTSSGTQLFYSHLDSFAPGLKSGATVVEGEIIGTAGTTGNAMGILSQEEHLHLTVKNPKGVRVDPLIWLNDPFAADPRIHSEPASTPCQCSSGPPNVPGMLIQLYLRGPS